MILTLELVPAREGRARADAVGRQTFGQQGGTIGRDPDSTWVLPDAKVSRCHARISCRGSAFYIEDDSVNGTFLNSARERLRRGEPQLLEPGDRLFIGPYTIAVSIDRHAAAGRSRPRPDDPYGIPVVRDPLPAFTNDDDRVNRPVREPRKPPANPWRPAKVDPFGGAGEDDAAGIEPVVQREESLDPMIALNLESPPPPPRTPRAEDLGGGDPFEFAYKPPDVVEETPPPVARFPAGYNPALDESQAIPGPVAPPRPVRAASPATSDLGAVLEAAGLDPTLATPELARQLGQILHVVVAEMRSLLQSRVAVKDEFGLRHTSFRPAENNPLKFSRTVEEALHGLLIERDPAYLDPVSAFRQAFGDIKQHQFALWAGLRQGFESMLAEFDPDRLQSEFEREGGKGLLPGRLRYWEQYRERLEALARDSDARFRQLFGNEFARAYAEQVAKGTNAGERGRPVAGSERERPVPADPDEESPA